MILQLPSEEDKSGKMGSQALCNRKPFHSTRSFEIISRSSSSAETIEKTKDNSQTISEDVFQEPMKEEFQESASEDENKDSKYIESTREELQELFATGDEDLFEIQKPENNKETYLVTESSAWT
ncbi:hypothetical protein CDAR_98271 [Caerostris darwini]|uniref:Uncharacterized protein n=1 Tax=Caerostris darwini TaxID=1538125 RepID=A0AAV4UFN2_9ARAC|nr:hypothetical protein CDAR_98271 [Caerostris darwini]